MNTQKPKPLNNIVHDIPECVLGWREWLALPELGLPALKAKVDTGARTSALHAFEVERFSRESVDYVRFGMHPLQENNTLVVRCEARLKEEREVTDSGGHREMRYVIETDVVIHEHRWKIELTLTNRDTMRFRMLLGRSAMEKKVWVDPTRSYLCGKLDGKKYY